jgi:putative protease
MEIVAPGGSLAKVRLAFLFGADAGYVGGKEFSLRSRAHNLSLEEIAQAVRLADELGKRLYVAVNIYARNSDLEPVGQYLKRLAEIGVHALILSDPAVLVLARQWAPNLKLHLSTQANTTNWLAGHFWRDQGVERLVLARELNREEVADFVRQGLQVELFVHGAMCMSYSGRCLLSHFLTGRDGNQGDCAQPCRWRYHLVEEKRPGEYFPIEEDAHGSYIMNSKDLNLLDYLPEMVSMGVAAVKIEGRMKSPFYLANVVRTYREAVDHYQNGGGWEEGLHLRWQEQLSRISHRHYTTGFFDQEDRPEAQNYSSSAYVRGADYLGEVLRVVEGRVLVAVKGKFAPGERLEFLAPDRGGDASHEVHDIREEQGLPLDHTKPNTHVWLDGPRQAVPFSLVYRVRNYSA